MTKRNYGIDLLRIVLIYMVCVLHTLGHGGILNTGKSPLFWFIEVSAYCAVDGFALISGYMANLSENNGKRYSKIVNMWFQAVFYSFVVTVFFTLIRVKKTLGFRETIKLLLPVTHNKFWYFTAYFVLMFAMPFLNVFIKSLNEQSAKRAFLVLIILFSFVNLLKDPFVLNSGYSALWIIVLYLIGALAKKIKLFQNRKTVTLICIWILCIFVSWANYIFRNDYRLINYISPTILLCAIIMVVVFSRINLSGRIISKISPLVFGIYLFQMSPVIWKIILNDAFVFVAEKHWFIAILYILGFSLLIFISGLVVEFLRSILAKCLRISVLSNKIVSITNKALVKMFALLK